MITAALCLFAAFLAGCFVGAAAPNPSFDEGYEQGYWDGSK